MKIEIFKSVEKDGLPEYMRICIGYSSERGEFYTCYYHFYSGSDDPDRNPIWCFADDQPNIKTITTKIDYWHEIPLKWYQELYKNNP